MVRGNIPDEITYICRTPIKITRKFDDIEEEDEQTLENLEVGLLLNLIKNLMKLISTTKIGRVMLHLINWN